MQQHAHWRTHKGTSRTQSLRSTRAHYNVIGGMTRGRHWRAVTCAQKVLVLDPGSGLTHTHELPDWELAAPLQALDQWMGCCATPDG